ncbi:Cytochrome b-c1 complex subunit 8, mitochondrial [Lecanora helva]
MGGGSEPLDTKHGQYLGGWGNLGSQTQKGITTYSLSANRQRPLAGALNAAVFNTWRRCRAQALYVVPPFAIAYLLVNWAVEKNEYYNSKAGRMADAQAAEEATQGGPVRA